MRTRFRKPLLIPVRQGAGASGVKQRNERRSIADSDGSGDPVINSSEGTLAHAVGAGAAVPARDVSGTSGMCPERCVRNFQGMNTLDRAETFGQAFAHLS